MALPLSAISARWLAHSPARHWPGHAQRRSKWSPRRSRPLAAGAGSTGGAAEEPPSSSSGTELTVAKAYSLLGLEEGASGEAVLQAKNSLLARHGGDQAACDKVEAAYDLIFMQLMRARLSGDLPVSANVRFADVAKPRPSRARQQARAGGPLGLPSLGGGGRGGGGLGVSVRAPAAGPLTTSAALVFGGLGAWALLQGLHEPSPAAAAADVPGLQLALGCAASVYLLRTSKRSSLPKALGITAAGLVAGILVGEFSLVGLAVAALFIS
eukprot:scaffold7.g3444.t1